MPRFPMALALAALAASPAPGQDSRERFRDTVLLLESGEPKKIAWGAWQARESLERRALPHLATALMQALKIGNDVERRATALVVLDALLAFHQTPKLAELEPLLADAETRRPALALLARAPKENVDFFRKLLAAGTGEDERRLAGNALAAAKAPGFAAEVLGGVPFAIEITLTDSRRVSRSSSRGESLFGTGASPLSLEGFPPIPTFRWSVPLPTDGVPVVGANAPLWLGRSVAGRERGMSFGSYTFGRERTLELDWIADLLDTQTGQLGIERTTKQNLAWKGAQAFERDVAAARQRLLDQHGALVRRLVAAQVMTPEEAKRLRCDVRVGVRDERGDTSEPLPACGTSVLER